MLALFDICLIYKFIYLLCCFRSFSTGGGGGGG